MGSKWDDGTPLVSVIIPTFNCAAYLESAICSVINQSYENLEIVVVDDGSTDNTKEILNSYIISGKIKYFYQKNQGPGAARNLGVKQSSGDWIAFLDSDDLWVYDKLKEQMKIIIQRAPQIEILSTAMAEYDSRSSLAVSLEENPQVVEYSYEDLLQKNTLCTPTMLIKKEIFKKVGLFSEKLRISEDHDLWIRMARNHRVYKLMLVTVYYRRRKDGVSAGNRKYTLIKQIEFYKGIFEKEAKEYKKKYYRQAISICYWESSVDYSESGEYLIAFKHLLLSCIYYPQHLAAKSDTKLFRIKRFLILILEVLKLRKPAKRSIISKSIEDPSPEVIITENKMKTRLRIHVVEKSMLLKKLEDIKRYYKTKQKV